MSTCDEFEVQIEQAAHGALSAPAELEAHVAVCVSCQAFAGLVRQVEGELAQRVASAERSVAWADCRRRIDREQRGMRLLPWTLCALGLFPVSIVLARGITLFSLSLAGLMALFFCWVFYAGWRIRRRWLGEYGEARTTPEGLVGLYRKQTAEDRRGVRLAVNLCAFLAGLLPLLTVTGILPHGGAFWKAFLGCALGCAAFALYLWRWHLRRLERLTRDLA